MHVELYLKYCLKTARTCPNNYALNNNPKSRRKENDWDKKVCRKRADLGFIFRILLNCAGMLFTIIQASRCINSILLSNTSNRQKSTCQSRRNSQNKTNAMLRRRFCTYAVVSVCDGGLAIMCHLCKRSVFP